MVWRRTKGEAARWIGYPMAERLTGRNIRAKLAELNIFWALPAAERRQRAANQLAEIVAWAGASVPYYRDLFAKLDFDPSRLKRDSAYLQELPYLDKEIIRAEGVRLLREDYASLVNHRSRTGGSTGPAVEICYDQPAADWSSAVTRHARKSVGKHHALTELHLASHFPEVFPLRDRLKEAVKCFAMNRANAHISDFEPESLDRLWNQIKRLKPHLIHCHPSTLYQLALHVETRGIGGKRGFKIFESSGELLMAYQRETISRVFGCRVIDRYGLAEFGVAAYQMADDPTTLNVYENFVWPETSADGEIVLTGLTNRMMPLIRYRTGDLGIVSGRAEGVVLSDLVGRVHDLVTIGGKAYPTHYIQDLLQRIGGIVEFQIQIADRPILRLVLERDRELSDVKSRLAGWWGNEVQVEFIEAAALKLTGRRGKFRHVVQGEAG